MRARLYLLMLVIMLGAAVFVGYRYFDELSQYLNAALVVQSDPDDSFLAPATGGELTAGREIGLALGSGDVLFAAYRAAVNNGIFVQQINDVPPMVQNGLSPDLNTDPGNASGGPDIALDEDNQAPQVAYVVYRKEDPNNNHEVRKIDISGSPPTTFAGTNALILGAGSGAEPTIAVRSGGAEVLVVYGAGGGPGAGVAGPLDLVRFDGNLANNNNPLGVSGGANVTLRPDIVIDDANDRAYVVFVDDDGVLWIAQVDISPAITEDPTLVATVSVAGDDAATSRPSARLYNSFLLVTYTQENAGAGTDELSLLRLPLIPDIAGTQPTVIRNVGSNVVSPSIVVDTSSTPDYAHIVYGNINDPDQGDGSPLLNAIRVDLSSFSGFSDEVQDLAGEGMVTTLETVFDPASGNIYSLFEEFGGGAPDLTKTNVFVAPLSTESPASSGEIDVVLSDALIASFDEVLTDVDDGDMVLYSNWRGFIPCDTSDSAGSSLSCVHPVFLPGETIQYMIPADGLGVNGLPGNNPHLEGIFVGATSEAAGTFSAPVVAAQGVNHEDVIAADFDGDGNLDLALSDPDNDQISILINQGDNTFAEVVNYDVGDTPTRLVVGDFNTVEAGYPDIVVINSAGNTVSVLLNNGVNDPGTFEDAVGSPFAVGDNPSALFVADFYLDNPESELDGNLDIVVVSRDGGAAGASSLTVLDGDGAGNFDAGVGIVDQTPIQDLSSFVYTDLDDDGDFDEIAADGSSAFGGSQLFISERDDPDETESVGVPLTLDANPNANVRVVSPVHDLDGDGNLDIVGLVPSLNLLRVFPGSGDVDGYTDVPTNITNICSDGIPSSVAQGDVDGGGELDIVVACAGATNEVIVLIHDDAFSYSSSSVSLSSSPNELILADMDGDGRLDLVVAMDSTVAIAYGEAPAVSTSSGRSAGLRRTHISDVRDSEEPPVEEGSTRHDAADGESGEPEGIIGVGGDGGGNSSDPLSEMEILEQFVGSATVEEIQQGSSLVEVPIVLIRRALSALRAMVLGDSWPQLDAYMAAGIEFSITKPELLSMLIQRLPDHEALLQRGYDLHVSSKGNSPIPDVTVLLKTVTAILAEIPSLPFGEMLERTSTCERQFPDRWYSCILREYHRDTPIKTSLEYAIQPPTAELLREVLNAVMGRL